MGDLVQRASQDCLTSDAAGKLLALAELLPHGVDKMSHVMDNLVETSCNFASVKLMDGHYQVRSEAPPLPAFRGRAAVSGCPRTCLQLAGIGHVVLLAAQVTWCVLAGRAATADPVALLLIREAVQMVVSSRSSVTSSLHALRARIQLLAEQCGATVAQNEIYPGWNPAPQSDLVTRVKQIYTEQFNLEPHLTAIHAGLEVCTSFHPHTQHVVIVPYKCMQWPGCRADADQACADKACALQCGILNARLGAAWTWCRMGLPSAARTRRTSASRWPRCPPSGT